MCKVSVKLHNDNLNTVKYYMHLLPCVISGDKVEQNNLLIQNKQHETETNKNKK